MGEIAVAIADDNERILDLLGEMIENNKEMKLVGKANNGEDVYTLIKEKQPDVVLLDLITERFQNIVRSTFTKCIFCNPLLSHFSDNNKTWMFSDIMIPIHGIHNT